MKLAAVLDSNSGFSKIVHTVQKDIKTKVKSSKQFLVRVELFRNNLLYCNNYSAGPPYIGSNPTLRVTFNIVSDFKRCSGLRHFEFEG